MPRPFGGSGRRFRNWGGLDADERIHVMISGRAHHWASAAHDNSGMWKILLRLRRGVTQVLSRIRREEAQVQEPCFPVGRTWPDSSRVPCSYCGGAGLVESGIGRM